MSNFQRVFVEPLVNLFSSVNCHATTLEVRGDVSGAALAPRGAPASVKLLLIPQLLCHHAAQSSAVTAPGGRRLPLYCSSGAALNRRQQTRWAEDVALKRRLITCNCFPPRLGGPGSQQLTYLYLLALDAAR